MYEYQISHGARGYTVLVLEVIKYPSQVREVDRRVFDFEGHADRWGQRRCDELEDQDNTLALLAEDLEEDMLDREYHARGQY